MIGTKGRLRRRPPEEHEGDHYGHINGGPTGRSLVTKGASNRDASIAQSQGYPDFRPVVENRLISVQDNHFVLVGRRRESGVELGVHHSQMIVVPDRGRGKLQIVVGDLFPGCP